MNINQNVLFHQHKGVEEEIVYPINTTPITEIWTRRIKWEESNMFVKFKKKYQEKKTKTKQYTTWNWFWNNLVHFVKKNQHLLFTSYFFIFLLKSIKMIKVFYWVTQCNGYVNKHVFKFEKKWELFLINYRLFLHYQNKIVVITPI